MEENVVTSKPASKKKEIFNDHIFGQHRFLENTDTKEGITNVKIETANIGNIPGIISHWKKDIERRKKNIIALKEQNFTQRMAYIFQKKKRSVLQAEANGNELIALHPSNAAKETLRKLQMDPTDMMTRIELVSIIGRSGRDFPTEVYRTLFLQTTAAATLGELNNIGLSVSLWAQEMYLRKLFQQCKTEINVLKKKIGPSDGKNVYALQSQNLIQHMNKINKVSSILEQYQQTTKDTLKIQPKTEATLNLKDLKNYYFEKEKDDAKKKQIFQNASQIMLILRHLPLLHEEGLVYLDILKKIDPHDPLVYLLHAKLNMAKLVFAVAEYRGGERNEKTRAQIQDRFKHTYHQYGIAVRKVGKSPMLPIDYTILVEYANLVHYFYRVAVHLLGIKLPLDWLQIVFTKSVEVLQMVEDPEKIGPLQNEITKDMAHAGLID